VTTGTAVAQDAQLTPMMAQYRRIKGGLPAGALLLFRLGDFYEMFFEDAQEGARLLNLALTRRQEVPMCGLPYHAAGGYIGRLLRAGRKVAICDQLEDARPGKLVKREVTQILSPGAHFDERMLASGRNNYLATIHRLGPTLGLAFVDLTTADFMVTEVDSEAALLTELDRVRPAELILPLEAVELATLLRGARPASGEALSAGAGPATDSSPMPSAGAPAASPGARSSPVSGRGWILNSYDGWTFAPETAQFTLRDHFKVASLDGFGLRNRSAAVGAAGAAVHYLTHELRREVGHLTRLAFYQSSDFLVLDATTLRHLEVLEPMHRDAPRESCLYGALNRTVTPMGARRLRDWLSQPLAAVEPIRERQAAVQLFVEQAAALTQVREALKEVRDLERTVSRLSVGAGNARDLVALRHALLQVPKVRAALATLPEVPAGAAGAAGPEFPELGGAGCAATEGRGVPSLVRVLAGQLADCPELVDHIGRAMVDGPPLALKEGGLIRDGYDASLDELRRAGREGKDWIARLQQQEIERTGIASLKVRFNSVFGYSLEVTKANLDKVPRHYIRKQTVASGERFITPELKEMEGKILGAEERSAKLEYELFLRVREAVLACRPQIQQTAQALGQLDALANFAEGARLHNCCRPDVGNDSQIVIRDGRHPVLDQSLTEERFVPNDTALAGRGPGASAGASAGGAGPELAPQVMLITGPNMAGKSTYIRQVALLTLLAHAGGFVPATSARIDLVDRIFTRIGASDDLVRGQSTFMVEMSETANILNNATSRSLIVLDEIGRGTSTFDGLSLAWSIVEHLHNQVGAKTLFATHYHELTELAGRLTRVKNFNVAVREWRDQIVFLRKIVPGGTDKSYGIQVARLAGVPQSVVERAKAILRNLEESELTPEGNVRQSARHRAERDKLKALAAPPQLDLFS